MTISEAAAARVKELIAQRGKPTAGVRIGVRTKGCSGLSYTLEYADEKGPMDDLGQPWPEEIRMTDDVRARVTQRWKDYGL